MENKQKNREWVKTAVIIFLVIMLVLTFFSNTIQNYTLTEVSTEQVKAGTIAERVRCTGKVISMGNTEVKAEGTRTIAGVKVKIGQEVNEGDILFVMGSAATDEVETAINTRDDAYYAYKKAQVSYPTDTSASGYYSMLSASQAYDAALSALDNAAVALAQAGVGSEDVQRAQSKINEAQFSLEQATKNAEINRDLLLSEYLSYQALADQAAEKYAEDPTEENLSKYQEALDICVIAQNTYLSSLDTTMEEKTAMSVLDNAQKAYDALMKRYSAAYDAYEKAQSAVNTAQSSYLTAMASYNSSLASSGSSYASHAIDEEAAENKYNKAQAKLDYLTGEGVDVNIYAPVSGKIQSIGKSAGAKVVKDDILCVIEVPDQGYTMEASVTAEQAKRLKVGDESVKSMYGGDSVDGTIISIRPDPKDPQNKRIIEFNLSGNTDNLENGKEITLTVGQKSVSYDLVVPKSAILSDTNGKFVLKIESKSSALGNRYFARRVDVQEIASDDSSCAVTGDLQQNSDHVITNSSAPVKAGNQIRLSDAS